MLRAASAGRRRFRSGYQSTGDGTDPAGELYYGSIACGAERVTIAQHSSVPVLGRIPGSRRHAEVNGAAAMTAARPG
jgi:hypothetical protein